MSRPQEFELHQFIDGQLSPDRAAEVERWLDAHPEEAAVVDAWQAQKDILRRAYNGFAAAPIPGRTDRSGRARSFSFFMRLTVPAACLAFGLVAGYLVRGAPPPFAAGNMSSFPRQAVVAHAVYTPEVRHPVEVGASQTVHLAQWLSKRLEGDISIPDLSNSGYHLLGGRLLPDESGPAAQFMYEGKDTVRLTLYVKRNPEQRVTAFRFSSAGKVSVFYWVDNDFGYALSGELTRNALLEVANSVHRQIGGR